MTRDESELPTVPTPTKSRPHTTMMMHKKKRKEDTGALPAINSWIFTPSDASAARATLREELHALEVSPQQTTDDIFASVLDDRSLSPVMFGPTARQLPSLAHAAKSSAKFIADAKQDRDRKHLLSMTR